jgi:predicted ATPase
MCEAVAMSVCFGKNKKTKKKQKIFFGRMVLCAVSFAGFLVCVCVCFGLTQLIQCREYRFAVEVSTCNNLPSKKRLALGEPPL